MVQPPRPWPKAPPRNHPRFNPEGLQGDYVPHRGGADLFFCRDLAPKSPQAKMMEAAAKSNAAQLAALIAAHPDVPPDFQNGNGITPLMIAAARNDTETLHLLANHPLVSLSQQSRDGWTALHYAAHFGHAESVSALLKRQADFKTTNGFGETAFSLAGSVLAQEAFWAYKPFVHYMKRAEPDHPRLQPPPPPAAPAAEKKPAVPVPETDGKPADIPLTTLFLRAAMNVGLSTSAAEGVYEELKKDIIAGRNDTLPNAYERIEQAAQQADARGQKIDFDWDGLLCAAAAAGNIPALCFIAKKRDYLDSKPLTNALAAVIADGADNAQTAEAAQWLLRWGADANASGKAIRSGKDKAGTLAYQAFARVKPMIFESICAQAGDLKSWHVSSGQLQWEQRVKQIYTEQLDKRPTSSMRALAAEKRALETVKLRELMHSLGHAKLTAHFEHALSNKDLCKMMAVYAETRTKRLLRGAFGLPMHLGAAAIVLALQNGRTAFARRLEADGHNLRHLEDAGYAATLAQLRKNGGEDVRAFINTNEAGIKTAPDILSIDDKYTMLRGMVSRTPVSGRGFGF